MSITLKEVEECLNKGICPVCGQRLMKTYRHYDLKEKKRIIGYFCFCGFGHQDKEADNE